MFYSLIKCRLKPFRMTESTAKIATILSHGQTGLLQIVPKCGHNGNVSLSS
jgi:hypothetical protein